MVTTRVQNLPSLSLVPWAKWIIILFILNVCKFSKCLLILNIKDKKCQWVKNTNTDSISHWKWCKKLLPTFSFQVTKKDIIQGIHCARTTRNVRWLLCHGRESLNKQLWVKIEKKVKTLFKTPESNEELLRRGHIPKLYKRYIFGNMVPS